MDVNRPSEVPAGNDLPVGATVKVRCMTTAKVVELSVDGLLGTGGMARVYAAHDPSGRKVALKVIDREIGKDERSRVRFLREKELADRVQHPASVPIELAGETADGDAALVMELVEGENLETVRRRLGGRVPLVPAVRIAEEILDFLSACHDKGVLHRDVKTANVLFRPGRAIRMVDYGIARCDAIGAGPELMLGTPSFMAPEQAGIIGEEDGRTDLFGVGAVLYTILLGKRLHRGRTHDESMFLAATQATPKIDDDSVPPELAEIIHRALAFKRDERWPDAASMRRALEAVRTREESRLSNPVETEDDGLTDGAPVVSSGSIPVSSRPPDARGTFGDTPLPHLLVHVLARELDGSLVVAHDLTREVVEFLAGAPVRRSAAATDDPILGPLARIARLPGHASYRFYIEDRLRESLGTKWTPVEPLDAILTSTRRLRAQPAFQARMRATLDRLGNKPLQLHPAAAPARFGLSPTERRALDAALEFELGYEQLIDSAMAPRDVVDPLLYALGITRHLLTGGGGTPPWPVGVPKPAT